MADKRDDSVTRCKVVLVGFESEQKRYEAVKKLAELLGISFDEAADLADSAPVDIVPSIPREAAENLAEKLTDAGALVEVPMLTKTAKFCEVHPHKYARARCRTCGKFLCTVCLSKTKGKRYCEEHYEIYRQKRILRVIGGTFLILLVIFLALLFRHQIRLFGRSFLKTKETTVAVLFVSEKPDEAKNKYFMKTFRDTTTNEYVPGEDHTVADIAPWFNQRYHEVTGDNRKIMSLTSNGLFEIKVPPPMTEGPTGFSYRALRMFLQLRGYFKEFISTNLLEEAESADIVMMIDLVERTGVEKDFMEHLGFWAGRYVYVRIPIKETVWPNDYYLATCIHYLGQCMGARSQLDDKGFPKYPEGLADPAQQPPYAQRFASVMACYRAVNAFEIDRPSTLDGYIISPLSAYELGWIPHRRIKNLYPKPKSSEAQP